jgi:spore coat polysaccharide biosynthesis protein SpsF (cytidylyltransferase family)
MHNPHKFKNKGFKMLESYVESENKIKDSLSTDILTFYSQIDELMNVINEYSKEDVHENLKNWKENYDWFYLSHQERIKKDGYLTYLQSADFKNRIAMQQVLVIRNKKGMLDLFNKNAQILLPRIKNRISND